MTNNQRVLIGSFSFAFAKLHAEVIRAQKKPKQPLW